MSEHDVAAKCTAQVIALQAQIADLRALLIDVTQQRADLQAEIARLRQIEAAAQAQSEDVQLHWLSPIEATGLRAETARLLTGLRAAKLAASSQAARVSNGFVARGEWHNLAEQLQAVIDGPAYVAPDVSYDAARLSEGQL